MEDLMSRRPALTLEPAALRLDQAAAYCGLSVETFKAKCPVKPISFTESSRGNRYWRAKLDDWLASLDPNGAPNGADPTSLVPAEEQTSPSSWEDV
jgi:hypothetical protein